MPELAETIKHHKRARLVWGDRQAWVTRNSYCEGPRGRGDVYGWETVPTLEEEPPDWLAAPATNWATQLKLPVVALPRAWEVAWVAARYWRAEAIWVGDAEGAAVDVVALLTCLEPVLQVCAPKDGFCFVLGDVKGQPALAWTHGGPTPHPAQRELQYRGVVMGFSAGAEPMAREQCAVQLGGGQ